MQVDLSIIYKLIDLNTDSIFREYSMTYKYLNGVVSIGMQHSNLQDLSSLYNYVNKLACRCYKQQIWILRIQIV